MKANGAPEKIYCTPTEGGFYLTTIKPEPPFAEGIEYIQTDAFIEKAVEWLKSHSENDYVEYHMGVTIMHKDKFIKDFRNYMKGE